MELTWKWASVAFICASLLQPIGAQVNGTSAGLRTDGSQRNSKIEVVSRPIRPFIEMRQSQQLINFDVLLTNRASKVLRLVAIRVSVYDRRGHLEIERELNENGNPPALDMFGNRLLQPGEVIDVIQPFFEFGPDIDVSRMSMDFLFMNEGHAAPPVAITADEIAYLNVLPKRYSPRPFCLPLRGIVLVHDGHDFYSHHRRYNLAARYRADPPSAVSANLYAYDFMTTSAGKLYKGDPRQKKNWLTYGQSIFAPGEGVVVEAVSDIPENSFSETGEAQIPAEAQIVDPMGFGNHVKIQHADGRVSWLLHMQPGSIYVRVGEHVQVGQSIGKVGFTGDSLFPHLHYTVTDGSRYPSQGVPSYFKDYSRVLGERRLHVAVGQVDTGDLIQRKESCR